MKRVLIYGGSFNPPTYGHYSVITTCLEHMDFDEVWLLPSGNRTDKQIAASASHRLGMLQIFKDEIFANDCRIKISDFELSLPEPTCTTTTVQAIKHRYPNIEFWFVFGSDSFASMPDWENGLRIQQDPHALIVMREGYESRPEDESRVLRESITFRYSSTDARQAIMQHGDWRSIIAQPVHDYIIQNRLYV